MELRLVAAGNLKSVSKVVQGTETTHTPTDGIFTSAAGLGALGVASGCQDLSQACQPTNPYAPALINNCSTAFTTATTPRPGASLSKPQVIDPAYILAHALQATRQAGTAAVSLAALQPGGKLCVTSLGTCKVMLVRNGEVWDETDVQLHSEVFGGVKKPYQIGHPSYSQGSDSIHDAQRYLWDVKAGDIVISGTETFFNNLKRQEILTLISQALAGCAAPLNPSSGLKRVASAIRRHTSGGGAFKSETRQSQGGAAATTAASSTGASSTGSSRGPSPEPQAEAVASAAAQAADLLAATGAKRLAKRKAKAAAAAAAAAQTAADASNGTKGSIFARLMAQPKPQTQQHQGPCHSKDTIACVVALVSTSAASVGSDGNIAAVQAAEAVNPGAAADLCSTRSSDSEGTVYQDPDSHLAAPTVESVEQYPQPQADLSGSPAAAAASDRSSNFSLSSSSSMGRTASEAESTSKLLRTSSLKDPRFSKAVIRSEITSDCIRAYQATAADQADSPNSLIAARWIGPELGESPTKLKLESRRSASARLLSAAAVEAKTVGSRVTRPGSQQQLHRMQGSYYGAQSGYSNNNADHYSLQHQQQRSRRATVGGSGYNSYIGLLWRLLLVLRLLGW